MAGLIAIAVSFVLFAVGATLYFLPTIIAVRRSKANVAPIVIVNVFLGWTILGWVGALAWAVSTQAADLAQRR